MVRETYSWCAPVSCPTTCAGKNTYCGGGVGVGLKVNDSCHSVAGDSNECIETTIPVSGHLVPVFLMAPNFTQVSLYCATPPPADAPCKEIVNAGEATAYNCTAS